ncbi:hypothetical protein HRG84_12655 [Flavisolibacter sp. BT320]|nr:hypothetical protein [Flavisolibacter longurius]
MKRKRLWHWCWFRVLQKGEGLSCSYTVIFSTDTQEPTRFFVPKDANSALVFQAIIFAEEKKIAVVFGKRFFLSADNVVALPIESLYWEMNFS